MESGNLLYELMIFNEKNTQCQLELVVDSGFTKGSYSCRAGRGMVFIRTITQRCYQLRG